MNVMHEIKLPLSQGLGVDYVGTFCPQIATSPRCQKEK